VRIAPKLERAGQTRHSSLVTRHSSGAKRDAVKVHIDELVLHGLAPADRQRIAAAVERELAQLMAEGRAPQWRQNPPELDRISGGVFQVNAGAKPQTAGTEIARAIFRTLRRQSLVAAAGLRARPVVAGRNPTGG
jgi:hypothetical protein